MKKVYSPAFTAQVVLELLTEEKSLAQLSGEAGNDHLTGGVGADHFSGDRGRDTAIDFTVAEGDTQDGTIP